MEKQAALASEIMAKFDSKDELKTCEFFISSARSLADIFSPISRDRKLGDYVDQVLYPAQSAVEERLWNASLLTIHAMIKLYPLVNILSKLLHDTLDSVKERETVTLYQKFLDVIIGQYYLGTLLDLEKDDE